MASTSDYVATAKDGASSSLLVIDHKDDPIHHGVDLLSFVAAVRPDTVYEMMEDGKRHARLMEEKGAFRRLLRSH